MQLTSAKTGTWIVVPALPDDPAARQVVQSLGIDTGSPIRVIRRAPLWGPLLLEVEGRTKALGWRIASRIEVQAIDNLEA